jgi:hypothetical protein
MVLAASSASSCSLDSARVLAERLSSSWVIEDAPTMTEVTSSRWSSQARETAAAGLLGHPLDGGEYPWSEVLVDRRKRVGRSPTVLAPPEVARGQGTPHHDAETEASARRDDLVFDIATNERPVDLDRSGFGR